MHWGLAWGLVAGTLVLCSPIGPLTSAAAATETEDRLNVVLISLDTVRPDHLSCYGYHRQTTPHIDRIAQDGVLFSQAFSQAPSTFPSHLSIFTSRYPTKPWVWWEAFDLEPSTESLPEILRRHGYTTVAFTDFGRHSPRNAFLSSRPFQAFDHRDGGVRLKNLPSGLFEWLKVHRDDTFFLFLHGYDAHDLHVLPTRYDAKRFNPTYEGPVPSTTVEVDALVASALSIDNIRQNPHDENDWSRRKRIYREQILIPGSLHPKDLDHLKALYDAQLYYLDQGLRQLFQALETLDLMERTLLVLLSDHGQEFGEHGGYALHGGNCYDEVTRMVLLLRDPRLARRGRKVHQLVQGIDVMPTILELLDLPIPQSAQGRSLVPLLRTGRDPGREEVAISVGRGIRAIRTPVWKLISEEGNAAELYDMAKDPGEQRNLIGRHPDIAARLQHRLDAVVSAEVAGAVGDPEEWMREHGYW